MRPAFGSLPYGFCVLVLLRRSQADINGNKDIRAAQDAERKFFLSREEYRHLADKSGTKYLQQVLNQQLVNHIREVLPILKSTLQKQCSSMEKEVKMIKKEHLADSAQTNTKNMVKMISTIGIELERRIAGGGGDTMDVTSLSGGARIAKVFHERFPYEMAKVQPDEKQLGVEIGFAIKNANGIRVGLFTPDEAFSSISKRIISKLLPACQKCADMVIHEIVTIVDTVATKAERFPRFQAEIKGCMTSYISDLEEKAKEQIELMIQFELAYINANHPDFIGFHNAAKGSRSKRKKSNGMPASPSPADGKIKCGWLQVMGKKTFGGTQLKDYWFVLTEDSISWYKDETEKDVKQLFDTEGLKVKDVKGGTKTQKSSFCLFEMSGKPMYEKVAELEITATSIEDKESWQAALLRANVIPVSADDSDTRASKDLDDMNSDPLLADQIMIIRNLVDSYMDIVRKKLQDTLPKICMHLIVDRVVEFSKEDLLGALYASAGDVQSLLEESATARQQREEMIQMYDASKIALRIITDVTMSTKSEPLPPPVENSIVVDAPAPRRTAAPASPMRAPAPSAASTTSRPLPPGRGAVSTSTTSRPPPPAARPKTKPAAPSRPAVPGRPSVPSRPTR